MLSKCGSTFLTCILWKFQSYPSDQSSSLWMRVTIFKGWSPVFSLSFLHLHISLILVTYFFSSPSQRKVAKALVSLLVHHQLFYPSFVRSLAIDIILIVIFGSRITCSKKVFPCLVAFLAFKVGPISHFCVPSL